MTLVVGMMTSTRLSYVVTDSMSSSLIRSTSIAAHFLASSNGRPCIEPERSSTSAKFNGNFLSDEVGRIRSDDARNRTSNVFSSPATIPSFSGVNSMLIIAALLFLKSIVLGLPKRLARPLQLLPM